MVDTFSNSCLEQGRSLQGHHDLFTHHNLFIYTTCPPSTMICCHHNPWSWWPMIMMTDDHHDRWTRALYLWHHSCFSGSKLGNPFVPWYCAINTCICVMFKKLPIHILFKKKIVSLSCECNNVIFALSSISRTYAILCSFCVCVGGYHIFILS